MKLGIPETKSLQMNGWFRWFISFWGTFGQVSGDVWQISFREFFNKLWCLSSLGLSKIGTTTWVGFSKNWGWWLLMIPQRAFWKTHPTPKLSWWVPDSRPIAPWISDASETDPREMFHFRCLWWPEDHMVIGSKGCSFTYLTNGVFLGVK